MKLLTYQRDGTPAPGALVADDAIVDLSPLATDLQALIERWDELRGDAVERADGADRIALSAVTLLAPLPAPRRNLFCVGKNYVAHAKEFGRSGFDASAGKGDAVPDEPIVFSKPPTSVIGPGAPIPHALDPHDSVDYEGEVAVVIGRAGRVGADADPMRYVFGYTLVNDVTSRELQRRHKQWLLGKGIDGFCPMGPVIVTADELADPRRILLQTHVNGELRQSAELSQLIFDIPRLVRDIGRSISFVPGDVIATGTPEGVGIGHTPPRYLRPGDVVRVSASGIGALENPVA